MADNVTLNTMSGGDVVGADDIGGVKFQRVKIIEGADGTNDGDISSANGLPVQLLAGSASIGILGSNSGVDIGDVTINNSTGASAVNIQDGGNTITVDNGGTFAVQPAGSVAHDATATSVNPNLIGGYSSAAAPTSVSADGESVRAWYLRNGAAAAVLTAAGALIGGDASNGLDVDVTRMAALVSNSGVDIGDVTINNSTGASAVNIQDGGNSITVDNGGTFAVQSTNQANSGVDIGDVTINNSTGGSAVNIQDGGNSITVDGTVTATVAAKQINTKNIASAGFTITLASLANGSARQSTLVDNSSTDYPAALVLMKISSGASGPTAGTVYEIYLIRGDGTIRDDNAGATDAAITIENAPLLGTMVLTNSTNKNFYGIFDTAPLGPLGPEWGIAVKNSSGQSLHGTEGNHDYNYVYYVPEVQ